MECFRRSKRCEDLTRIRQASVEQDCRDRSAAATWPPLWSGSSTTSVYSFAYVAGEQAADDGKRPATFDTVNGRRATPSVSATGCRRRYKKAAPPPPQPSATHTISETKVQHETSTVQRRTGTVSRKKYRAPQPPPKQAAAESQSQTDHRRPALLRGKKGPAPKPPAQQQQQQQRTKPDAGPTTAHSGFLNHCTAAQLNKTESMDGGGGGTLQGSNVGRKIPKYEIEKHFLLQKNATTAAAENTQLPSNARSRNQGFASPAATNPTVLNGRVAEIFRLRIRLTSDDHINAIIVAASDEKRPDETLSQPADDDINYGGPLTRDHAPEAVDDLQKVRHKHLAFFQRRRAAVFEKRETADGDASAAKAEAAGAEATVATTVVEMIAGCGKVVVSPSKLKKKDVKK